jgi:surface antigen
MQSRIAAAPSGQRRRVRDAILVIIALSLTGVSGCSSGGAIVPTPAAGATEPAAPPVPTGAALGAVLGGPVGASLTDDDRAAAWNAQVAALDSGQKRSWRGAHGVFGFVEPGAAAGDGCRAYSQTLYIAGRPTHGRGVGCKQSDGSWKMTS